jgi:hypothetical protein
MRAGSAGTITRSRFAMARTAPPCAFRLSIVNPNDAAISRGAGETAMARVMMRCPTSGDEFDTSIDVPRKAGLQSMGLQTAYCPQCQHHHHIRNPYFYGDAPSHYYAPADGLETAPTFAMEVGIIIAAAAFMESYIPQIFSKVSGMSSTHAVMTFGAFPSVSQKIGGLEVLRDLQQSREVKSDLKILIEKFRKCATTRDFYAHAKYHYSGGLSIMIFPFFCDSKKRRPTVRFTLDEMREDANFMQRTKYMIRSYINDDVRPTR